MSIFKWKNTEIIKLQSLVKAGHDARNISRMIDRSLHSINEKIATHCKFNEVYKRSYKTIEDLTNIELIVRQCAIEFGITPKILKTKTRITEVVIPRQVAQTLSLQLTHNPISTIAREIGNQNHATVFHSDKVIGELRETNVHFNEKYSYLRKRIMNLMEIRKPSFIDEHPRIVQSFKSIKKETNDIHTKILLNKLQSEIINVAEKDYRRTIQVEEDVNQILGRTPEGKFKVKKAQRRKYRSTFNV